MRRRSSRAPVLAALAAAIVAGCDVTPPVHTALPIAEADDFATARIRGGGNGLEVIRWSVPNPPDRTTAMLEAHRSGGTLPQETLERLRAHGFTVAEVPIDALPATLGDLGGTLVDMRSWHGQMTEWRDLLRTEVDEGQPVFGSGRMQSLRAGSVRLAARSWTVPMEDGGLLWLEIIPQHVSRAVAGAGAAVASRDRLRGDAYADAGLAVALDPGWSLLVAPTPIDRGPVGGAGPAAEAPPTLGALLLPVEMLPPAPDTPPQARTPVLVFLARLPDALVPPTDPATEGVHR